MSKDITAAPLQTEVAGKPYRLSPLRDRDFGEFLNWCKDQFMDLAKRNLDGLEPADRQALLTAAYNKASKMTLQDEECLNLMVSIDGAAYLLYMSVRREMPEITFEKARDICTDPEAMGEFSERINELNGFEVKPDEDPLEKDLENPGKQLKKTKFIAFYQRNMVGRLQRQQI